MIITVRKRFVWWCDLIFRVRLFVNETSTWWRTAYYFPASATWQTFVAGGLVCGNHETVPLAWDLCGDFINLTAMRGRATTAVSTWKSLVVITNLASRWPRAGPCAMLFIPVHTVVSRQRYLSVTHFKAVIVQWWRHYQVFSSQLLQENHVILSLCLKYEYKQKNEKYWVRHISIHTITVTAHFTRGSCLPSTLIISSCQKVCRRKYETN